jgi:hypothetical protein
LGRSLGQKGGVGTGGGKAGNDASGVGVRDRLGGDGNALAVLEVFDGFMLPSVPGGKASGGKDGSSLRNAAKGRGQDGGEAVNDADDVGAGLVKTLVRGQSSRGGGTAGAEVIEGEQASRCKGDDEEELDGPSGTGGANR